MVSNNVFLDNQFGFRAKRNTEHALLKCLTNIYRSLNKDKSVSGIFHTIKKFLSTEDNGILLHQLYNGGKMKIGVA